jgi:hypothetical protein
MVLDSKTLKFASDKKYVLGDKCVNKENRVDILKSTLLSFGPESFVFHFVIQKYKD